MKHSKGFTLIEMMICVAIVGIMAAIVLPAISGSGPTQPRTECRFGYVYAEDSYLSGDFEQVIGANGGGVSCDEFEEMSDVFVDNGNRLK